jgi:DNA-binding HxlR family transcriptional regulator
MTDSEPQPYAETGTGSGPRSGFSLADAPVGIRPCSLAAALEVLGERWSLLALREIGYGVHRFARIAGYTGASRDILADRLRKLEAAGVIERRRYSEHPPRDEYHFTEAGRGMFPATLALSQWGDKWAVDTPFLTRRHSCGEPVQVDLVCHHCGQPVTRDTVHAEPAGV